MYVYMSHTRRFIKTGNSNFEQTTIVFFFQTPYYVKVFAMFPDLSRVTTHPCPLTSCQQYKYTCILYICMPCYFVFCSFYFHTNPILKLKFKKWQKQWPPAPVSLSVQRDICPLEFALFYNYYLVFWTLFSLCSEQLYHFKRFYKALAVGT